MTEPKHWGTYKVIFDALDKAIKEKPEAFEELEKNPYMLWQRKPDAKVYTIPNIKQEFIIRMKTLLKKYNAKLEWSHWCDEVNPIILIEGEIITLDDLFEEDE